MLGGQLTGQQVVFRSGNPSPWPSLVPRCRAGTCEVLPTAPCAASAIVQQLERQQACDWSISTEKSSWNPSHSHRLEPELHTTQPAVIKSTSRQPHYAALQLQPTTPQPVQYNRPSTENGITPAKVNALMPVLRVTDREIMVKLLHKSPALASVPAVQVEQVMQALQQELGLSFHEARLMTTRYPVMVLSLTSSQLLDRAKELAQLLSVQPSEVLQAAGSIPSILKRDAHHLATHLTRISEALDISDMVSMLKLAAAAPQFLTATPNSIQHSLQTVSDILRRPAKLVVRALHAQPDLLFISPRILYSKVRKLQRILGKRPETGLDTHHSRANNHIGSSRRQISAEPATTSTSNPQRSPRVDNLSQTSSHRGSIQNVQKGQVHESVKMSAQESKRRLKQSGVRPFKTIAQIVLACPQLMGAHLNIVGASFNQLAKISERPEDKDKDLDYAFGMVCHKPQLLLQHPQILFEEARHLYRLLEAVPSWRQQYQAFTPAQRADCFGLTAPTRARLSYLIRTGKAAQVCLHDALIMSRKTFLAKFPDAANSLQVQQQIQRPLPRVPKWVSREYLMLEEVHARSRPQQQPRAPTHEPYQPYPRQHLTFQPAHPPSSSNSQQPETERRPARTRRRSTSHPTVTPAVDVSPQPQPPLAIESSHVVIESRQLFTLHPDVQTVHETFADTSPATQSNTDQAEQLHLQEHVASQHSDHQQGEDMPSLHHDVANVTWPEMQPPFGHTVVEHLRSRQDRFNARLPQVGCPDPVLAQVNQSAHHVNHATVGDESSRQAPTRTGYAVLSQIRK